MKRKSIISMLLLSMMLGMFSSSCQDMLTPDSERHAYSVAEDTLYSYWGILKSLQNIAERYVILNECRGDLVDASGYVSDTIGAIVNFGDVENPEDWKDGACAYLKIADFYHVINSCNAYIAMCDTDHTTGTNKKYMLSEYCQVKAIRAWVYMQLLYAYGENRIPFYKEPMLTTDDIENFMENKNYPKVSAQLLAEELGPELEEIEWVEYDTRYGLPQYNNYGDVSSGNGHFVCHSSKCMFPVSIVLGDLYLLSGKYEDAAAHYYKYINTQNCGPLDVDNFYARGVLDDRQDYPIYTYTGNPYREPGAVSRTTEMITCIPSNKGKLEGRVMTDINRLFGFEAEMHTTVTSTSDDDADMAATVMLSPQYERELIPSRGYEALCDSQKYEIYMGTTTNNVFKFENLVELRSDDKVVGDARRTWIYRGEGRQYTFQLGDNINLYGKMVTKQNPGGGFSTTYPVIYRKSTVWLRYAEALNRAGFPSYAFAILKTGLCNNPEWYPIDPDKLNLSGGEYVPATDYAFSYFASNGEVNQTNTFDYPITDSVFLYFDFKDGEYKSLPDDEETILPTYADLEAWLTAYFQAEFDAYQEAYQASLETEEPLEPMESPRTIDKTRVYYKILDENSIGNQPNSDCGAACYYLDLREVRRAASLPYMDYQQPYMRGQSQTQLIYVKEQGKLLNQATGTQRIPSSTNADRLYTIGVHQRGCGFIRYDDPEEYGRSSYNYVAMVQKKIKEATGKEVTADDIYSGEYDEDVQNAVEDLIIDEMALELAFEGSRFSDLYRVAQRRGPDYLAERVAKRHTGEVDEHLRSWLQDKNHWFLPLPEE